MKLKAALVTFLVLAAGAAAILFLLLVVGDGEPSGPAAEAFAYQNGSHGADGELPVLWDAPEFAFPDQAGETVTPEDLRDHVWISNFIFTRCTTVCPTLTAKMVLLQRRLQDPDIRFVSFSVDPEYDTPEVLDAYAEQWNADETRWHLLSTAPDTLADVARGMRVAVSETDDPENPILHSSVFLLSDGEGRVRGVYDSNDPAALDRLVADARDLAARLEPGSPRVAAAGEDGAALYADLGCAACHDQPRLAPALGGVIGRTVKLEDGTSLTADVGYVRESITAPGKKVVAGYLNLMPSYEAQLSEDDLEALVRHVSAMKSTGAAPDETATVEMDPVCGMKVRVTEGTPSYAHEGRTYHFCSEMCRDRFARDPEAILEAPGTHGMGDMGEKDMGDMGNARP